MSTTRLEAFSDGVIAILITIMVLELKVPHGMEWAAVQPTVFTLLLYVMSFVYLGIYWTNHHHMFHATDHVNGAVLWANLHLLFWLSLVPFTTAWMGEKHFAATPTAVYGGVLLMAAIAYWILLHSILRCEGPDSVLRRAVGADWKGLISPLFYVAAIAVAPVKPAISWALYALVALIWIIPDRRIERVLAEGRAPATRGPHAAA
ncbi:MAG TPA: TMEM175 family protein, partial [Thermoanaerobaculia bacterium]|nr:TMEM175 family protein [Thermoanaerobaculia bacterium]